MGKNGSEYVPSGSCAMVCWRLAFDIISASLRELAVRGRFIFSARLAGAAEDVKKLSLFLPMAVAFAVSRRFDLRPRLSLTTSHDIPATNRINVESTHKLILLQMLYIYETG